MLHEQVSSAATASSTTSLHLYGIHVGRFASAYACKVAHRSSIIKFAIVNGQRQEAQRGLLGKCPVCDDRMIAKCGELRHRHWAHPRAHSCDPWWENESEWRRAWKQQFPDAWQEIVHLADDGTRHIADVRTERGWIIEFQRSHIATEERRSRNAFYKKLAWVVDGKRRTLDASQFETAWNYGTPTGSGSPVRRVRSTNCRILREWSDTSGPVFFDFGGDQLGCRLPCEVSDFAYVTPIPRNQFVFMHRIGVGQEGADFDALVEAYRELVANHARALKQAPPDPFRLYQLYSSPRSRRRL